MGGHAPEAAEHVPPFASLPGQPTAEPAAHRRRDGEDELVEVLPAAQLLLLPAAGRARAGGELAAVGRGREAGKPLDGHQRLVPAQPGGERGPAADHDRADVGAVPRRHQLPDLGEESEAHPSRDQRLVDRREDGLAHPGPQLPEDRALVVEPQLGREEHPPAGGEPGPGGIALLVREHQVVLASHDRRLERRRLGAVPPQPVPEVEVVDGVVGVAVAAQPVRGHPGQHGPDEVDQVVEPAGARVGADRRARAGPAAGRTRRRSPPRRREPASRRPPCLASSSSCWLTASSVGAIDLDAPGRPAAARARASSRRPASAAGRARARRRSRGAAARCGPAARRPRGRARPRPARRAASRLVENLATQGAQPSGSRSNSPSAPVGRKASRQVRIGQDGSVRLPVQLRVALAHDPEGVVVVAEPDVEAVLLDPAVLAPARRPLPAEAEAALQHRDRCEPLPPAGLREPPRRDQAGHAAAEDEHPWRPRHVRVGACAEQTPGPR